MDETKTRRIVLLGKSGSGKSSLANTIFGENVFKVNNTFNSETKECREETRPVNGGNITLIDTPGFFDTDRPEGELRSEILNCITDCVPELHAFLIVLKVDKFSKQEMDVIKKICEYLSDEAFKYAAVVFTHAEQLPERMKIEELVQKNKDLSDVMKKCGGRYQLIDNKYWNNQQIESRSNKFHVEKLLNTVDEIVENNEGCYTNEMLQKMDRMNKKYGKTDVSYFLKMSASITTGALLGALLGVPAMIASVVTALMTMEAAALALGAAGGVAATTGLGIAAGAAAATGAVVGGRIGYREANQADSVGQAAENTAKAVWGFFKQKVRAKVGE